MYEEIIEEKVRGWWGDAGKIMVVDGEGKRATFMAIHVTGGYKGREMGAGTDTLSIYTSLGRFGASVSGAS